MDLWTELNREVESKLEDIRTSLILGRAADYNDYTRMVGYAEGMGETLDILKRMMKSRSDEDENATVL